MKRRKALTPREKRLIKKREILLQKSLTPRKKRLEKKRVKLLSKRAAVMKNKLTSKKAKKKIDKRVKYIKNRK